MKFVIIFLICVSTYSQNNIRFHTGRGVPICLMYINGKLGEFIIDTGASDNYIDKTVKKKYKFLTPRYNKEVIGLAGDIDMYLATNIVTVHNDTIVDISFKSMDMRNIRNNKGVIGVIGSKWLQENRYIIDYKRKMLWLKK